MFVWQSHIPLFPLFLHVQNIYPCIPHATTTTAGVANIYIHHLHPQPTAFTHSLHLFHTSPSAAALAARTLRQWKLPQRFCDGHSRAAATMHALFLFDVTLAAGGDADALAGWFTAIQRTKAPPSLALFRVQSPTTTNS